jgi:hypothetical protein
MDSPDLDDGALLRRARVGANALAAFFRRHSRACGPSLPSDCGDPECARDSASLSSWRVAGMRVIGYTTVTLLPRLPGLVPVENTAA